MSVHTNDPPWGSSWAFVTILALGTFAVSTDAFIVAGLLPSMATTLRVSVAAAGQSVTIFAMTYAVFAPILATGAAKIPRRTLLVGALLVLGLANLGAALAPNFTVLLIFRALAAVGAAVYTPTAGAVAAAVARPAARGRALAIVVGGLTVATVVSVPLGYLANAWVGWRITLSLVAVLCFIIGLAIFLVLPIFIGGTPVPLLTRLAVLRQRGVVKVLPLTVLGMAASYTVYAYSVPAFQAVGISSDAIGAFLLVYGLGAVLGSIGCGYATDRWGAIRVLSVTYSVMTVALGVLAWLAIRSTTAPEGIIGLLVGLWGASTWSQTPPQQHRLVAAAPHEIPLTLSLNASAIYLGIGSGTALGGVALTAGVPVVYGAGAGMAALALFYLKATA